MIRGVRACLTSVMTLLLALHGLATAQLPAPAPTPTPTPTPAKVLVYCAWGFEIGGDCAEKLRERGIDAVALSGGIGTWRANGLPTEPLKEKEGEQKLSGSRANVPRSTASPAPG